MCTVVILHRPGHDWPVLIAANRDEMAGRPWRPPGRHWPERAEVTGGLDGLAGGTWLAMNDWGVVAGILNREGTLGPETGKRSRGELPLEAMDHAEAGEAARALRHIDPTAFRAFNMVIADRREAFWLRHREDGILAEKLPPGLSMVTAHDRNDTKASARQRLYLPRFRDAPAPDPQTGDWTAWERLLADRRFEAEAGPREAMCIVTEGGFGTTSSSLIAVPASGRRNGVPAWLFTDGRPGEAPFQSVAF